MRDETAIDPGNDTDLPDAVDPTEDDEGIPPGAIVVGVDGSGPARQALAWAVAEACRRPAPLHLMCARETYIGAVHLEPTVSWTDPALEALDGSSTVIDEATEYVTSLAPEVELSATRPWGRPAQHLVAASHDASLIVVGSRGQGPLASAMLGTVSLQTAVHAHCPVVVVREGQSGHPGGSMRIAVGIDGSADSIEALRYAFDAAGPGGHVDMVLAWWLEVVDGMVVTTPDSPQWARVVERHDALLRSLTADIAAGHPGVSVERHVRRGHTEDVLLGAAAEADLLAVGSRGRGGFKGLLMGSVSQHMLARSPCPVVVMPNNRHERPA